MSAEKSPPSDPNNWNPEAETLTGTFGTGEETTGGVIGSYHLLQRLGQGGMGEVWLAEQKQPVRRRVAIKLIKAGMDTREVVTRFESERQALALMDHPAIAKVFDAGSTPQGRPFFVMEYVTGISITAYCDRHKLSIPQRLELFIRVCEGVEHAHHKAILHRDLKPSNILVGEMDGKAAPRIIDFGVAKATSARLSEETMYTQVGAIIGTPGYMSPEQADSAGADVDTRTDVYSLGVVLYELLVGAPPLDFSKTRPEQYSSKLRDEDASKPSTKISTLGKKSGITAQNRGADSPTLARLLRGDLDAITLKALEKERARRYGTPAELAADIGRYMRNEPVVARPASSWYRARKYVRRHRFGVAVSAAAAVVLVSLAFVQALDLRRTRRERDRADRVTQFMIGMFKVSDPSEARGNDIRAREILDKASKDIDTGLAQDPQLQAQMMQIMGNVYESLGLYQESETLLRRAVEIRQRTLGPRNVETLKSMSDLGYVLNSNSKYSEAEKWSRETVDGRKEKLGPEHADTLASESQLALIFNNESHYAEAEKLHREVLDISRRKFGEQDPLTMKVMKSLAIDLAYEGKFDESEKVFRDVLASDLRALGPEHPKVLGDMNNLAATLQHEQKWDEAEKLYLDGLQAKRRVLGPEHPDTLMSMGNLALVYSHQKRYADAEKLFRETLEIKQKRLGPEHRSTLVTMGNLGEALIDSGKYDEAGQLFQKTLELERRILGPDHSDTLQTVQAMGTLLKKEKRYPEAEATLRQALSGRQRGLGADHPDTASSAYLLASVLALEGNRDEAISNLKFAVEHDLSAEERAGLAKDDDLKALRGDTRFEAILATSGQKTAQEAAR